jgi:hypothetical protein
LRILSGGELLTDHHLYCEIMRRAAAAVGGEEALAQRLRRDLEDVRAWLAGSRLAPFGVYVEALELLWQRTQASERRQ